MDCPSCKVDLVMSERQGIEIDYCPKCRGVWLDRGELDKIIERAADDRDDDRARAPQQQQYQQPQVVVQQQPYYQKPYKRKSFLSELFD
ncbi:zf-TFIIB domain-containing protein [bacterium]|nr:zf-TFIIB domain-containing protein [bacterium]